MDATLERVVDFAHGLRFADLPEATAHACVRLVVDSVGCAVAAYGALPPSIARRIALRAPLAAGARVWGTRQYALPELAAFANGALVRYIDANDAYPGTGGHPSDMIAGLIAVAEAAHADGRALIAAIALAYEVYHEFRQAKLLLDAGIDSTLYSAIGSATGAALLLGLDRAGIGAALALAITPNVPLEVTRRGELSMWKGCAGGNASRNGVFAALLAAEGLTGPTAAIDGVNGLRAIVRGFDTEPFARPPERFHVADSNLKSFPSCFHAQSPITAALQLAPRVDPRTVDAIAIRTHRVAWEKIGYEPEKWHPANRETADHSMPYVVAAALVEGRFAGDMFTPERLRDPRIADLMRKISIEEDPAMTAEFPERAPCAIAVTSRGVPVSVRVDYPLGHAMNPLSDEQLSAKFTALAVPHVDAAAAAAALEALWLLPSLATFESIFDPLVSR